MEQKKGNKKLLIALVALVVVVVAFVAIYLNFGPKTSEGEKSYTVEVVDASGDATSYTGNTDAEYLVDLMDELSENEDFSYEGSDGDYGLYIDTINGLTADYATDGAYWSIYVNGEYGSYGADSQPVTDGDTYQFVYETYSAE